MATRKVFSAALRLTAENTTSEGNNPPIHYFDRIPARAVWVTGSGNYGTASNWDIGSVPNANHSVHCGSTASGTGLTYTVTFGSNVTNGAAVVS